LLHAVLNTTAPVFALILAGYIASRLGLLGPEATVALNRFVVYLGLPALLFGATAGITRAQLDHPGYILAVGISLLGIFGIVLVVARLCGRSLADAGLDALAASYPNTGYMGFPLAMIVFGPASLLPTVIATILVASVLFALALVVIEIGTQATPQFGRTLLKTGRSLVRNPIITAPILGGAVAVSGFGLPTPVATFAHLLGETAGPCALVTLGLFFAQTKGGGRHGTVLWLVLMKLLVQPALTWLLVYKIFPMPPLWAATALLLNALPTGTGPFMLAEFYRREAGVTARVILLTTVLSIVTTSILVARLSP
jgi:malonate transporter